MDQTLIIVPSYNEYQNAHSLVSQILQVVPDSHVLLVDDNSPDGTADYAANLFRHEPRFSVLRRSGKRGLGRSYLDGYRRAAAGNYARVVQMDADFSHDPRALPDLISASQDVDVVIGSRYCAGGAVRNWSRRRKLLSKFANQYVRSITGMTVHDSTSGFRCYNQRALRSLLAGEIVAEGYAFLVETTYRVQKQGLSIVEVPITFTERRHGKSKISRRVILESMLIPWRLRYTREK